jgi:hypothetical protein
MGKTKDLGHLAHIVAYDAENHITVPAGITMHTNQLVASQAWVTTALGSYALSSALSSYVPTSRTITINGTTFDLSANRSWTIAAGIVSVSGTSPINVSTTSGAATVSISQANTSTNGFLSSTDWNTFNGKQNALTIGNIVSNDTNLITVTGGTGAIIGSGVSLLVLPSAIVASGISSTLVTTALGYTPVTNARTITINGTTLDLSANRSFTVTASETDTLATVTARGATTTAAITTGLLIAQGPGGNYNENVRLPGSTAVISFNTSGATGAGSYNIVSQTNFQIRNVGGTQVFILDQSGNLTMSGTVTAPTFSGALSGNATTATAAAGATFLTQANATWGARLQIGGNGDPGAIANIAVVQATDGNLHMDSGTGKSMYLNFYRNGIIYLNGATYFISANGSQYNGNAATATTASTANAVAWGNVSSKPSLIMYYQGFTLDANTMDGNSTGFTYSVNAPYTGPIARFSETGYSLQLNAAYGGGGNLIAFRTRNGDAGTFNPWREFITSGNIGSQKVDGSMKLWAVTHPSDYYMVHNWTGSHWYLTVNHPSPVRVGYADNSGTTSQTNFSDLSITGAAHKYLTINPGNGYEAMVRYIGGSGSSWYVGKRTSAQLVGTQSFHFYSEEAGATVGGIDPGGSMFAIGSMRSPIFYDSNDTGFYLDPNSESNLNRFTSATMTRNAMNYLSINSPYGTRAAQARNYQNGTMGWGTVDFNTIFSNWGSGFIDTWSNPGNAPGGSSHYVGFQSLHYNFENSANAYGFQMACAGEASNRYFWRNAWPGIQSWVEMMHSGNFTSFVNAPNAVGNPNGYYNVNNWMQMNGAHGIFWPSYYSFHIRPNITSSYTQMEIIGNKNGYGGIYDNYSAVSGIMYDGAGNGGVYREANGLWYFYYHIGNNCMGIGTSTTSGSYQMYVGGAIYATGDVVAYSDARKKINVVTIDKALETVTKMRGVFYNKIGEEESGRQLGVIAQEVDEVLPEAVSYAKDIDEYGVKYGNLGGLFIEAFKEQQKQIKEQAEQISELKSIINGITK